MNKIKSKGTQIFNVPNNDEGKTFFELAKKFKNKGVYLKKMGRGSRKEHGDQSTIPIEFSEWIAVYLGIENSGNILSDLAWHKKYCKEYKERCGTLSQTIMEKNVELKGKDEEIEELNEEIGEYRKQIDLLKEQIDILSNENSAFNKGLDNLIHKNNELQEQMDNQQLAYEKTIDECHAEIEKDQRKFTFNNNEKLLNKNNNEKTMAILRIIEKLIGE